MPQRDFHKICLQSEKGAGTPYLRVPSEKRTASSSSQPGRWGFDLLRPPGRDEVNSA